MNLRQLKRITCARMAHDLFYNRPIGQWMTGGYGSLGLGQEQPSWVGHSVPELVALCDSVLASKTVVVDNLSQQLASEMTREVPATQFVCKKVKDDSIVNTFDTREEALALVNKHIKGKKSKLYVLNTLTGMAEQFAAEEMPA